MPTLAFRRAGGGCLPLQAVPTSFLVNPVGGMTARSSRSPENALEPESAMVPGESSVGRKARGAFYTPPEIARFVSEWAVRAEDDQVLEPSCGEAEFLLSAGLRLRELGAGLFAGGNLHGVELHAPSAQVAVQRMLDLGLVANVQVVDFFDLQPEQKYDAVIGNPPYVRYQDFAGKARAKALKAALRQGIRLSGLASSWAAFVIHAAQFVAANGRLGLVLPAELLGVKYAAKVRRFLLQRFGSIRLVMFEELVFPAVQEEIILLLAEGNGPASHFEVFQARSLADLKQINHTGWVPFIPGAEDKWLRALLPSEGLRTYREVLASEAIESLADWGTTYLGIVTGNNRYFTLTGQDARELGFSHTELLRISPPGSRHLRGLTFTRRAWTNLSGEDRRTYLFFPDLQRPSDAALRYVSAGEAIGVQKGFKCRNRFPWWRVPLVSVPDLFLTYMDRDRPRIVTNRSRVHHLNSLYGVKLRTGRKRIGADLLPIASLNSLTLLGAELVGRAYGGGILKLEPREADNLPLPSAPFLETVDGQLRALRPQVSAALRKGDLTHATKLVDRVLLSQGLGLSYADVKRLRDARQVLFRRRITRAGSSHAEH